MKPNLGFYVQTINKIVQDTEAIGETMNPNYEELRNAIDTQTVASFTPERLAEIADVFAAGTQQYETMMAKISTLRPPARVMGIHKKFERSYKMYVEGCQEMIASIRNTEGVDVAAFDASEKKQDEATDDISFSIQRMTKILLGK